MNNKLIMGVDIGGTKIMAGVINSEGKVIGESYMIPTGGNDSKEKILERIFTSVDTVMEKTRLSTGDIQGIGLGVTGPLDMKKGIILECPQLPTMNYFPLKEKVEARYKIPVYMDNDANSLMLGESYYGAGKDHDIILGFTLGTGLGCATVLNKKVFWGATQTAGEIWPSPYESKTIEDYVSGAGISQIYQDFGGAKSSALEIAEFARLGEDIAFKTWIRFGQGLAYAIAWGINFIDPNIVILGGSIANAMAWFYPAMDKYLRKHICPVPGQRTKIVRSELGDLAGFIGAACLVLQDNNIEIEKRKK